MLFVVRIQAMFYQSYLNITIMQNKITLKKDDLKTMSFVKSCQGVGATIDSRYKFKFNKIILKKTVGPT